MIGMSTNPVADNFLSFSAKRMKLSQNEVSRCLDKLTEKQLWHRGGDYENSIGNLLLHLEGNIRQWIPAWRRQPAGRAAT